MIDIASQIMSREFNGPCIFAMGQAGFIVKSSENHILAIDLYLSDCVERLEGHIGYKRLIPKLIDPADISFDAIICTHPHYDHFDVDAVPIFLSNGNGRLFCSVDCDKLVEHLGLSDYSGRITYVKPGDYIECGEFFIEFINCDHGKGATDAVGVILTVNGKRILEVGDTCLRLDRIGEYLKNGAIDVMIAPINGAYGNMNEEECAMLSDAIKPLLTIPCHFGMFASHGGSPGKFFEIMKSKYPNRAFMLMAPGDYLPL